MKRTEYVKTLIPKMGNPLVSSVEVFTPINIALIKYWGKRDSELMLPWNTSLSVTLDGFGTLTRVTVSNADSLILNGQTMELNSDTYRKVFDFLHLICGNDLHFQVDTYNNIPTASGLASSASSFASFAKAVDALFGLNLSSGPLSCLARLGSISAARSILPGFILLENDKKCEAKKVESALDDFCIGICMISEGEKKHKSRDNMDYTVSNSVFYETWLQLAHRDLYEILPCIQRGDFDGMGSIAERNALCMHASIAMMQDADRVYLQNQSLEVIKRAQLLRKEGLAVYCTMDAGPNVKLLFSPKNLDRISSEFPQMKMHETIKRVY